MQLEHAIEASGSHPARLAVRRIQPSSGFRIDLPELWRYRELGVFLIWRDIKARYRQTLLGGFWAIFRPFVQTFVFTILFTRVGHIQTGTKLPYQLFVLPGLLIWTYFSSALTGGASAITGNAQLVTKAYFPRIHLLLAAIVAPVIDFVLSLLIVVVLFLWYQRTPNWHIVFLPVFVLLTAFLVFGLSLWLAPLTVRYRDVPYGLPFLLQIWMFLTPIIYGTASLPPRYSWIIKVNPFSGLALGTRWAVVGGAFPEASYLALSIGTAVVLSTLGIVYFRRREPTFPDFI